MTPLPLTEEALEAFKELNGIFGFVLELPKSAWGQILEDLGPILSLALVPGGPPPFYLSQFKTDKPKAQICELIKIGRASSAALQQLAG